jgi:gamma-D-glutamyl-L-lysine dipeptidyl-peptidase
MKPGICLVPVSPLRAEPSHRSEMVSQLIFGEACDLLEYKDEWVRISVVHDRYEGWTLRSHLQQVPVLNLDAATELASDYINTIYFNNVPMQIPMGSMLQHIHSIKEPYIVFHGKSCAIANPSEEAMIARAKQFLNTAYLWGGRTVFGIDCSGFTQMVYRFFGINLSRDAYQQAGEGELVGFLPEVKIGDLAFFDNEEGKITHVGMMIDDQHIIHASGKVRIDKIDNAGILNVDTNQRTHKLRVIKRYF